MTGGAGPRAALRVAATAAALLGLVLAAVLVLGPATGRWSTRAVLTGSMSPAAPAGSAVVSVPARPADLRVGDVVTLAAPPPWDAVVTHRVVEVRRDGDAVLLRTRGDASAAPDPWLARVEAGPVPRAVLVVPHLGTLTRLAGDPRTSTALVWAAAAAWLLALWAPVVRRRPLPAAGLFDLSALPAR